MLWTYPPGIAIPKKLNWIQNNVVMATVIKVPKTKKYQLQNKNIALAFLWFYNFRAKNKQQQKIIKFFAIIIVL